MKLVRGDKLTVGQQQQVLAQFTHRWTHENARQTYGGKCSACEQTGSPAFIAIGHKLPGGPRVYTREQWHAYHVPLISDREWLKTHKFYVKENGDIADRPEYCESVL